MEGAERGVLGVTRAGLGVCVRTQYARRSALWCDVTRAGFSR